MIKTKKKENIEHLYRFIINEMSKQKPIATRIIPNVIINEFNNKVFKRLNPNFGDYVIGNVLCDMYIPQSVNHCILFENEFIDTNLFDISAEYNKDGFLENIYYKNEQIEYKYLPQELIQTLAEKTKSTSEKIQKEFDSLPCSNIDKLLNYFAMGDVSVTFMSDNKLKLSCFVTDYIKRMNNYIHICPLNKNDSVRFSNNENKTFSVLTEFFIKRLIDNNEDYKGKIVVPMFDVGKYKKPAIRDDFIYVGYSNNNKTVPNSKIIIKISEDNIPIMIISENYTINLEEPLFETKEDFRKLLDTYKNSFNSSLFCEI